MILKEKDPWEGFDEAVRMAEKLSEDYQVTYCTGSPPRFILARKNHWWYAEFSNIKDLIGMMEIFLKGRGITPVK